MKPSPPLWALLVACVVAAMLAFVAEAPARAAPSLAEEPSGVIFPRQQIPLHFDHARHVKFGMSCVYCHTKATTSTRGFDRLLPEATRCDACHGTGHDDLDAVTGGVGAAALCAFCHVGHRPEDGNRVARVAMPAPNLVFDHAAHFTRGVPCVECHGEVASKAIATRADLPTMKSCLRCHGAAPSAPLAAPGGCDTCHLTAKGRLRTEFDTGRLLPPAWMHGAQHGADWIERHKMVAGADSQFCATCHAESECVDCHDGRVRPRRIHPNDWLGMHAMAARQNDPSCTSCHREQSFCLSCHERVGVTLSGAYGNLTERGRFHPSKAVWTDPPRTARHHSWEAQRSIQTCVGCHSERDCATCHATAMRGGRGGLSPHPAGFGATCGNALASNPRPCLFCHDPSDPSLARCR